MKEITMDEQQVMEQSASASTAAQIINGVNAGDLNATVEAIKAQPEIAKFQFRASNKWVSGGHNMTQVNDFYGVCQEIKREKTFTIEMDEPPILLGTDRSANPVESALSALAGCLTTTLIYHAAAQGVRIESVESKFEGDTDLRGFLGLDETLRRGLDGIRVKFKIKADASPEKIQELIELAQARSGVFDMLNNGVPISVQLT